MSYEGALSIDDFLVSFSNIQNESFSKMQKTLMEHDKMLKNIQSSLESISQKMEKSDPDGSEEEKRESESPVRNVSLSAVMQDPLPVKMEASEDEHSSTPGSTPYTNMEIMPQDPDDTSKSTEIYCFNCKQTFVRGSGKFTRHIRETLCKPYQCHCGKLFKKKSSLKSHKSTHSSDSFPCKCGAVFRCEQYLKNHKRRKNCIDQLENRSDPKHPRKDDTKEAVTETPFNHHALDESFFTPMNLLRLQMQE